ncbi:hypothetical protein P4B35_09985 [Pontiellaceae bacterium B12227]|nr:hypothetical protein [Pontiellaceae bacterium B12227]
MDFFTQLEMDRIGRVIGCIRDIFPWISLLVLLVTTIAVALSEKRRRSLVLELSAEEERIEGLDIDSEEKDRLFKAIAPLPESREAYPLPDLSLRLISALAKVFGFLKIVLLLGTAYGMLQIARMPDAQWNCDHPVLTVLWLSLFVVFALLQIVASTRVTRGRNWARRFLIVMAVLDIGSTSGTGMPFEVLWRGVLIAMSVYTLWVLLLRKYAQGALMHEFRTTRIWQKVAVIVLCLLSLLQTPFQFRGNVTLNNSFRNIEFSFATGGGGTMFPVRRVVLQAGDSSAETWRLMEELSQALDTQTELIEFGKSVRSPLKVTDLYLLICKTVDVDKEKPPAREQQIPREVLKLIAKDNPEVASHFLPQQRGDKEIAFEIETILHRPSSLRPRWRVKTKQVNDSDLRFNVKAEYSKGALDEILEDIRNSVAKAVNEYIADRNRESMITELPDVLAAVDEPFPIPEYEFMSNAVLLARTYLPDAEINLYRLGDFSAETVSSVSNQLISTGWKHDWNNRFEHTNRYAVIRGPKVFHGQHDLPHVYFIDAQCRKVDLTEEYLADFCQTRFGEFIEIFQPRSVSAAVYRESMDAYLKKPALTAKELLAVYQNISNWDAFKSRRPELLFRFAEQLYGEPAPEETFELYSALGKEITVERSADPVYAEIEKLYADRIIHLELVEDTNGLKRVEGMISGLDQPRLITFSKPADDSVNGREVLPYFFMGHVEMLDDGQIKSLYWAPNGRGSSTGKKLSASYIKKQHFSAEFSGGESFGSLDPWGSQEAMEKRMKSGDLLVVYEFLSESNELSLNMVLNDDAMTLCRTADGQYQLDDVLMMPEELALALQEERAKENGLGVIAYFSKEDKKAFWKDVSRSQRPVWIRYEDPVVGK